MKRKGCKVDNIAIMSGDWTVEATEEAGKFGLTVIEKPFKLEVLRDWLNKCEKGLIKDRKLSDWLKVPKLKGKKVCSSDNLPPDFSPWLSGQHP